MPVTKELLELRLASLKAGLESIKSNFNAQNGAIQECEYWLSQFEPPPETEKTD